MELAVYKIHYLLSDILSIPLFIYFQLAKSTEWFETSGTGTESSKFSNLSLALDGI